MKYRARFSGLATLGVVVVSALLSIAPKAMAQLSADPYNPWNSQYDAYVYPSFPGGTGVYSNQEAYAIPRGNRGANRFAEALEDYDRPSVDKDGPRVPLRRGVGIPYTRAYRDYDRMYNRVYTPNENIDDEYNASRQKREEAYSDFRLATDPKKRSEYRKNYDYYNRQTLRELMLGGRNSRSSNPARSTRGTASPRTDPSLRRPRTSGSGLSSPDAGARPLPARPRSSTSAGSRATRGGASDALGSSSRRGSTAGRDSGSSRSSTGRGTSTTDRDSTSTSPLDVLRRSQRMNQGRSSTPAVPPPSPPDR
jgi:hypothetical protein